MDSQTDFSKNIILHITHQIQTQIIMKNMKKY